MKKIFAMIMLCILFNIVPLSTNAQDGSMQSILIASQESEFKSALVEAITQKLESEKCCLKITNLKKILKEKPSNYEVIVIINSCWAGQQTRIAEKFLKNLTENEKQKVIVITTANSVDWKNKITGIDAITSASKMNNVNLLSADIVTKIKKLLKLNNSI